MLKRFYLRLLLLILSSTEEHIESLSKVVSNIEKRADLLERSMEEEAVHLATLAQNRRRALEAVEASYDRKESLSHEVIGAVRSEVERAAAARASVTKFLETL